MTPEQEACFTAMNARAEHFQKWLLGVTPCMGTRTAHSLGLEGEFGCITGDGLIQSLIKIEPEGFSLVPLPGRKQHNTDMTVEHPEQVFSPEEFQSLFNEYVTNLQRKFIEELKEFDGKGGFVNWKAINQT